ncbi:MAG: prepilin peptidase [Actinomycetota bacterium]
MLELIPLVVMGIPVAISDIKYHRIPNRALVVLWILEEVSQLHQGWHFMLFTNIRSLLIFITGCVLHLLTGTAIGMGDIKLFALLALLFGDLSRSMEVLTYAAVIALIYAVGTRKRCIPFAPALLLGAVAVILGG